MQVLPIQQSQSVIVRATFARYTTAQVFNPGILSSNRYFGKSLLDKGGVHSVSHREQEPMVSGNFEFSGAKEPFARS